MRTRQIILVLAALLSLGSLGSVRLSVTAPQAQICVVSNPAQIRMVGERRDQAAAKSFVRGRFVAIAPPGTIPLRVNSSLKAVRSRVQLPPPAAV